MNNKSSITLLLHPRTLTTIDNSKPTRAKYYNLETITVLAWSHVTLIIVPSYLSIETLS